jgi:2-polyprenyl-3-methyl-5-hydroxy-6-metoxy-1,4-benzoquinol methylase
MLRDIEFGEPVQFWSKFPLASLARINLSFVALWEMLSRHDVRYSDIGSFGAGSCTHEVALALLAEHASVHCYDATDAYIPARTRPYFEDLPQLHFELYDFSRPLDRQFDLVLTIQMLEQLENVDGALDVLAGAVRPGGHLYIDTSVFHEQPEREAEYDLHKERAWSKNNCHHIGFNRRLMAERLGARGLEVVDAGFYSYVAGDHSVMRYAREREAEAASQATRSTVRALNRALWTALTGSERAYADRREQVDELLLADRVCFAIRLLARRPPEDGAG